MRKYWRLHSRSIVCTVLGVILIAVGYHMWPDGGNNWDVASGVGTVMLAFGLEGVVNVFREVNRPEK